MQDEASATRSSGRRQLTLILITAAMSLGGSYLLFFATWLWTVTENCAEDCAKALKNLQATHILLNREAKRVRRAFSNNSGNFIPENQPDLKLVNTANQSVPEGIYIIDPNGNLVFRYAIVTNPKDILQDLKRLLKVSQIG